MRLLAVACAIALSAPMSARAQGLPSEPIVFADGRVTIAGDLSWSFAPEDTGFFNYSDYQSSTLRMLRLALTTSIKAGNHLSLLGEVLSENGGQPEAYALYLRLRPWADKNFDIQGGRVPPTFGAFTRRTYAADNPLIGYPLAYQYLTSIRTDALPSSIDELLKMRGRGWLSNYTIGNLAPDRGLPLISGFRWDTGVQIHGGTDVIEGTASVTAGPISNPQFRDSTGGRQYAGRVVVHPFTGLIVGASAAHGPFVEQSVVRLVLPDAHARDFGQVAWGADAGYSSGYYLLRVETVASRMTLPMVNGTATKLPLSAVSTSAEGRYKLRPGLYVAARFDHLGFSEVGADPIRQTWDAPVTRVEIGAGYSIQRNLTLKVSYQHNVRNAGRVTDLHLPAAQIVYWF